MDPNQTQTSPAPAGAPSPVNGEGSTVVSSAPIQMPQPDLPAGQAGNVQPLPEKTKSSRLPILLIALLVVLIATGAYFVLNSNNQTDYQASQIPTPLQTTPMPTTTPTPQTPQEEVEQVTIDNPATDIQSVTTDVNQL